TAREQALALRSEGVDLVVVLSHSGIRKQADGLWGEGDIDLLREVPEIDVIVGGHSHTVLKEPLKVDGRLCLQAGSDTKYLGELTLFRDGERWAMDSYTLHPIDDSIGGDPLITAFVGELQEEVTHRVLEPAGYDFEQVLAESPRTLTRAIDDHVLGNLVTDALRVAASADVSMSGSGALRADVWRGRTGLQRTSDLFRIMGLGIGTIDDSPGYAVVKGWVTGRDLKDVFEFLLIGYQLKGKDYYPRISGAQVTYNNNRVPFDRVVTIAIGDDSGGYVPADIDDDTLYSAAFSTYVGSFLPQVSKLSYGLLDVTMRHEDGTPAETLDDLLFDVEPNRQGVQELKGYKALFDYVAALPDHDGDGIPELPHEGPAATERLIQANSWAPAAMLTNATWKMWVVMVLPMVFIVAIVFVIALLRRRWQSTRDG
ncbi:MAG: bifunctional metallophosphatase/5'-nucleotidase, partial [Proteobacteria bacterium]|nr:bifunctional metallophosphatase/5'-nucleotidase [Pseudomonadota bacterium]